MRRFLVLAFATFACNHSKSPEPESTAIAEPQEEPSTEPVETPAAEVDETLCNLGAIETWPSCEGQRVKLEGREFLGRAALVERKHKGLARKLVGLEMVGRGIARHGYPVLDAHGTAIGQITSGSPAPTLGTNIGLAYVPTSQAGLGNRVLVDVRGKHIEAKVVSTPFYKRPGS